MQPDTGSSLPIQQPNGDWDAILAAARQLHDYDYEAQVDQDARDIHDAEERVRMLSIALAPISPPGYLQSGVLPPG